MNFLSGAEISCPLSVLQRVRIIEVIFTKNVWALSRVQVYQRGVRKERFECIRDRRKDLFRWLDWLPFKDEVNLQRCSLIYSRIRNEDACRDDMTKLLPRNSDLRSDSRASRYGRRFNLVYPFSNREQKGGVLLKFVELSCEIGFLLTCERWTPLARLRMLLKTYFLAQFLSV